MQIQLQFHIKCTIWYSYHYEFSRSVVSNSLWSHELQHARPTSTSQLPEFTQTHVHWISDAIQPYHPLLPSSPPAINLSQHRGLFQRVSSLHQVAKVLGVSASVLLMNIQNWFPLGLTGWMNSQESSPTPQFKSINSSVLSFLYGPTLTSIHDYWKNHSFD